MEKINEVVKVKITGIQTYGAFVTTNNNMDGLIHISEISYGYVKNINDYIKIGDKKYEEAIGFNDKKKHLKLSIKDIDYKNDGSKLVRIAETKSGFKPLKNNLDKWINDKIKEIMDKM